MTELREVFEVVRERTEPIDVQHEWGEQVRRQRRVARNRRIGAISLAAALAAVAGAVFLLSDPGVTDRDEGTTEPAERSAMIPSEPGLYLFDLETERATPLADIVPWQQSMSLSPDGTTIAYSGNVEGTGELLIHVANVDGTNIRPLRETASTGGEPVALRFSPDGSRIVYQAVEGQSIGDLFLVEVATGETMQLTDPKPVFVFASLYWAGPSFSPDGETVLFTRPDDNYQNQSWDLWSVPVSGGDPRLVIRDAVGGQLSPDGQAIAYFTFSKDPFVGDLWIADPDGTHARRVATGNLQTLSARWSPDGTKIAYAEWERVRQGKRGATYVFDLRTGETSKVLDDAYWPEWVDDHTWIVGPPVR